MKKRILLLFLLLILPLTTLYPHGVGVVDATQKLYLKLLTSRIDVQVQNQVSIVKTTQIFRNEFSGAKKTKYAFPLPEDASATKLRWKINGVWHEAFFSVTPQDTTLPGGGPGGSIDPNLSSYLGKTPLFFAIPQTLSKDSTLIVELTYVEFLKYSFGSVDFFYPGRYSILQSSAVLTQEFSMTLQSERTIDSIKFISQPGAAIVNNGLNAQVNFSKYESPADFNYQIRYSLNLNQLGLYGLSTYLNDSVSVADSTNGGYFAFIAEPAPSSDNIVRKVFTLIIDQSGSMGGNKIVQARNAARFIVKNLNQGDKFNIIAFATEVKSFRSSHVDFNPNNMNAAISFIDSLQATSLTNISGAFGTAIPQFSGSNDSTANIIIFFTDGQPTTGLTNTQEILNHVHSLVQTNEHTICIFTFGIGSDVNKQLLTLLASQNNGISEFLGSDELQSRITQFYMKIRNPVLINTSMSFSTTAISETYPNPLPNLYKGQQLMIVGRYNEAPPTVVTFTGHAFGQQKIYHFPLGLADSSVSSYQFLTKVWAKGKIENLLISYYSLPPSSLDALTIKNQIIKLSLKYGVITPFTSFSGTPVELVSFRAMIAGDRAILDWHTATEVNNSGFYIERRLGSSEWTSIKFIPGKGSTTEVHNYQYIDDLTRLNYSGRICYRLKQVDYDGTVSYSGEIYLEFHIPDEYSLQQNYPNPFNPVTHINYSVAKDGHTSLVVYNILGEKIATLVNNYLKAGKYSVEFNASNLPSGIYICRMESGNYISTRKMTLVK